jgi:curved DNA-binding protein CbpA
VAADPNLPDYYEVLQVDPDADLEVIEAAYR